MDNYLFRSIFGLVMVCRKCKMVSRSACPEACEDLVVEQIQRICEKAEGGEHEHVAHGDA